MVSIISITPGITGIIGITRHGPMLSLEDQRSTPGHSETRDITPSPQPQEHSAMPSITLNNPEDKATVKRFLSSPETRIITATVARLYVAYPDPHQWTYSGIIGAVALVQTTNTFYLRIVDLLYGRGIVWEQELYAGFVYSQDKPFFHSFQTEDYIAGLSFANEHEADVFYGKVNGRAQLRPFKPVSSGEALTSLAHIGWNQDVGFDSQNVDPAWLELYGELNRHGVSQRQLNKDAPFIAEFVNAHGGLKAKAGTTPPYQTEKPSDPSRIDSPPPPVPQQGPQQKRPPPPPPPPHPAQANANASVAAPAPFHGYITRPLAHVMASLSLGASSFYGSSTSSSPSQSDPAASDQVTSEKAPSPVGAPTSGPPPPPPLPPPMPTTATPSGGKGAPLSISTARHPTFSTAGRSVADQGNANGGGLKSPVESALLASIRETGGLQGLRKTGKLRSPPPVERGRPASPLGATNSQGDLVSALVAALQQRQTKVTYSDDEGNESDDGDSWDADD
ncbi:hypothetical protein BGX31_005696 [Mortierella sp. GBA43]|nr:hypothetical protein BGX31_005696 [Mortierella sp. GBA43]